MQKPYTPKDRMESTTVYLRASQRRDLRTLSERTKVPEAEYIRQGIDLVLSKYGLRRTDTTPEQK